MKEQRVEIENKLKKVEEIRHSKGKSAAIFDVFKSVRGEKRQGGDLVAMKDPSSGKLILEPEEIKTAALNYCVNLLQNNKPDPEFENEIYTENLLHYLRSYENCDDETSLEYSDFESRLRILASKHANKYKFLVESGQGLKDCLFELYLRVWNTEIKPQQWRNTTIVQIYKMKGNFSDFNNQRNIHVKDFIPKVFEGLVVDKSKEKIVSSCSKFQIGGMPHHRSQEHLFCVKSVIALYLYLNLPLFIQIFDVSKYFDKESLKDAMDTLYKCGIRGKLYRLWYELYRDSQIRVKTAAGTTGIKTTGENVTQGSIGGAVLSSANLDKTLTTYFSGSDCEISYGEKRLSVLSFQDDALRMCASIESIKKGNLIMEAVMKRKQLSLGIEKCSIITFGKRSKVKAVREAINKEKSIQISNHTLKVKEKDEYLGDILHEGGLSSSVKATIDKRYSRVFWTIIEVSSILNDFRIDAIGGLKAGLEIFELAIIPSLLNNSDTWVEMDSECEKKLEKLQNIMFKNLFAVPESTPKPILRFDLGNLSMIEKVHIRKLNLIHHLKYLKTDSLGAEFYSQQVQYNFPGLVKEGRTLIKRYSLPDIIDGGIDVSKNSWKQIVKKAVKEKSERDIKKEFSNYSKLEHLKVPSEKLEIKEYVTNLSLRNARTKFRY